MAQRFGPGRRAGVRSRTGVPVSPQGAEPGLSHPARRSRVHSGGRDAAPSAHQNQLCCQFLPVCNTKRCQLPVTMKLQFRGALNVSGNKALTLQAVSRALQIAQAPLLEVLFLLVNVGRKNHPQPPANRDVVETACEINGNGSFPLQGASSKRLEARSLLPPPARAATCARRRAEAEVTPATPRPDRRSRGTRRTPQRRKGEKCNCWQPGQEPSPRNHRAQRAGDKGLNSAGMTAQPRSALSGGEPPLPAQAQGACLSSSSSNTGQTFSFFL